MSNPYARLRGELQVAVAEQLAAGATLGAICAQPGMPCRSTVWNWARAHPWFAEMVVQAQRRANARKTAFSDAKGAAFLARVAAGERTCAILADPAMPGRAAYRRWRHEQGHFAAELYRLRRLHDAERGARARRSWPWDPVLADRLFVRVFRGEPLKAMLCADPALPSLKVVARWRREQPEFDQILRMAIAGHRPLRGRAQSRCTPQIARAVAERVAQGASFAAIARARGMPSVHTLYSWMRKHPDFAETIAGARDARGDWCDDQLLIAVEDAPSPAAARDALRRLAPLKRRSAYLRKKAEREG